VSDSVPVPVLGAIEVGTPPLPGALAVPMERLLKFQFAIRSARKEAVDDRIAKTKRHAPHVLTNEQTIPLDIVRLNVLPEPNVNQARVTIE